ncbi:MAG: DNA primase [Methanosarcinaceae archaeon]|nr:DNA primase [Methanosarcinaceae archaeon]
MQSSDTTKYIIHTKINADGVIERPDIVGAIFGQTEGLLGSDLDLRELQKTGRIGRIEVMTTSKAGKTRGNIFVPSGLDKVRTAVLAASLETIERVGPCLAKVEVTKIEDVRASKRANIIERAKTIYSSMFDDDLLESQEIADLVRESVRIEEVTTYGKTKIPAGPNYTADSLIVVEGRADIINLLKYGIKNTISVGGTSVPPEVAELTKTKKNVTVFTDGDRGGELIIRELLQVAKVDFVARPPDGKAVEDLVQKEIIQALRRKLPVEQYAERNGISYTRPLRTVKQPPGSNKATIASRFMEKKSPKRIPDIRKANLRSRMEDKKQGNENQTQTTQQEQKQYEKEIQYEEQEIKQYQKQYQGKQFRDKQYQDKQFPEKQYQEKQFKDNHYQEKQYQNNHYQEKQYQNNQYQEKQYQDNQYQDKQEFETELRSKHMEQYDGYDAETDDDIVDEGIFEKSFIEKNLDELKGTMSARLIGNNEEILEEIPVRDLTNRLKRGDVKVNSLVFDGVITQRLIDVAAEQGILEIAGLKVGSVVKMPANIKIITE